MHYIPVQEITVIQNLILKSKYYVQQFLTRFGCNLKIDLILELFHIRKFSVSLF